MRSVAAYLRSIAVAVTLLIVAAPAASAADRMYFPAYEDVISVLVSRINAETQRVDISAWYLSEHAISIALANRHRAGVQVRVIGDRVAVFESDRFTKQEFYWLAQQGVPIRLRYNPDWFPEIVHWKAVIFAGQRLVSFGSANFTPFELAPVSATDYKDETVLLSDNPVLVDLFKSKFDRMWNDTTAEPNSRVGNPPYFRNWDDACAREAACSDYASTYPNRVPMVINTNRLEPDRPEHPDMVWSQGPAFNNRLIQEINAETTKVDLVAYRLTVNAVADALIAKHLSGVPVRLMIDPEQYTSKVWPEYWLTHANVDRMWAAGIPIRQRVHTGLTHMKTLITSSIATNASSNIAEFWQRDHNYFVPAATNAGVYNALQTRYNQMWETPAAFGPFNPQAPDAPSLSSPANGAVNVAPSTALVWARAPFATSYDVYLGTSPNSMTLVGNVPAVITATPPETYSWTSTSPLPAGTPHYWRVVSRTFATPRNASLVASSTTRSFTTQSTGGAIPAGWTAQDIGNTGLSGSSSYSNGVFSISGAGADIWGTSDGFRFVYQTLAGDGVIVARVVSQQATHNAAKAGIMIRSALSANSSHVILDTVPAPGIEFMTRASTGGSTTWLGGASGGAPRYLRLTRSGGTVTSAISPDGSTWTTIGSTALPTGTAYVGMVVSSLRTNQLNTSTFDNVSITGGGVQPPPPPPPTLPDPWVSSDIGSTTLAGSASFANDVFTVSGSGADLWGTQDGFRYVYRSLPGDGVIVARLTSVQNTSSFAKAGVMIRRQLTGSSAHVILSARPNNAGIEFMTRPTAGGQTNYLGGASQPLPNWLRLTRSGTTVTAAVSTNGVNWGNVGSTTLPAGDAFIGLVVSSVNTSQLNTSTFDNVQVTLGSAPPPPPPPAQDVVIYASDIPASGLHGSWSPAPDPTSPDGIKLATPDQGDNTRLNSPSASPVHYVDVTFNATAGVPYTLWLRLQALGNAKANDAVWVQFSDALANGSSAYPLNSTSGLLVNLATDSAATSLQNWGWANGAYWFPQSTTFTFANSGSHTMRIQIREDGVAFDQIVLSAGPYLSSAPGGPSNDSTIVPKP